MSQECVVLGLRVTRVEDLWEGGKDARGVKIHITEGRCNEQVI